VAANDHPRIYRSSGADSRDNRDIRGRFQAAQAEVDRFWSHVDLSDPRGCWPWIGTVTSDGKYGRFLVTVEPGVRRYVRAHRYAWLLLVGPIAPGHTLDHLIGPGEPCTTTACVRVFGHLESVSNSENLRRRHERDARRRRLNGATQ